MAIQVTLEDHTGNTVREAKLSDIAPIGRLIPALVTSLGLPITDPSGRPIAYRLSYNDRQLQEDETLHGAGVQSGDSITLVPEMMAGCFPGSVRVTLSDGRRIAIQDVKINDELLSGTPGSKIFTEARVVRVFKDFASQYLTLNGTLHITESHPIWANNKWVRAGELKIGDLLQDRSGNAIQLKSIDRRYEQVEVYNLYVASEEHTFYAEDILVHNAALKEQLWKTISKTELPDSILRIQISLPSLLTFEEFLDGIENRIKSIEFIYSIFALTYSMNAEETESFISFLKKHNDSSLISNSLLQRLLISTNIEPLRLVSVHYGSPASIDLLGIGKVLEVLRDTLKDLIWRAKYEKQMADLELKSKEAEVEKEKLEVEKRAAEITAQHIELLGKAANLQLSDDDKRLLISVLLPKLLTITYYPVASILMSDNKVVPPIDKS
jgi:hypothetical protein